VQWLPADGEAKTKVTSSEQRDVGLQVVESDVSAPPVQTHTSRQQRRPPPPLQGPTCLLLFSLNNYLFICSRVTCRRSTDGLM